MHTASSNTYPVFEPSSTASTNTIAPPSQPQHLESLSLGYSASSSATAASMSASGWNTSDVQQRTQYHRSWFRSRLRGVGTFIRAALPKPRVEKTGSASKIVTSGLQEPRAQKRDPPTTFPSGNSQTRTGVASLRQYFQRLLLARQAEAERERERKRAQQRQAREDAVEELGLPHKEAIAGEVVTIPTSTTIVPEARIQAAQLRFVSIYKPLRSTRTGRLRGQFVSDDAPPSIPRPQLPLPRRRRDESDAERKVRERKEKVIQEANLWRRIIGDWEEGKRKRIERIREWEEEKVKEWEEERKKEARRMRREGRRAMVSQLLFARMGLSDDSVIPASSHNLRGNGSGVARPRATITGHNGKCLLMERGATAQVLCPPCPQDPRQLAHPSTSTAAPSLVPAAHSSPSLQDQARELNSAFGWSSMQPDVEIDFSRGYTAFRNQGDNGAYAWIAIKDARDDVNRDDSEARREIVEGEETMRRLDLEYVVL